VYPEPFYGENNRETIIPESLNKTSYWYRAVISVPKEYAHRQTWIHFDGANFSSESLGERQAGWNDSGRVYSRPLRHHQAGQAG